MDEGLVAQKLVSRKPWEIKSLRHLVQKHWFWEQSGSNNWFQKKSLGGAKWLKSSFQKNCSGELGDSKNDFRKHLSCRAKWLKKSFSNISCSGEVNGSKIDFQKHSFLGVHRQNHPCSLSPQIKKIEVSEQGGFIKIILRRHFWHQKALYQNRRIW